MVLACISPEQPTAQSFGDSILVADGTPGRVDKPRTLLEVLEKISIDKVPGILIERAVDGHNVALIGTLNSACLVGEGLFHVPGRRILRYSLPGVH